MKLLIDIDEELYETYKGRPPMLGDEGMDNIAQAISNGTPVYEHERLRGEWITHRVAFHLTCPFCGCNLRALKSEVFEGDYDYNFCPNCGCDMRKPNCVTCDHFGKCEGCERSDEE